MIVKATGIAWTAVVSSAVPSCDYVPTDWLHTVVGAEQAEPGAAFSLLVEWSRHLGGRRPYALLGAEVTVGGRSGLEIHVGHSDDAGTGTWGSCTGPLGVEVEARLPAALAAVVMEELAAGGISPRSGSIRVAAAGHHPVDSSQASFRTGARLLGWAVGATADGDPPTEAGLGDFVAGLLAPS